jgi:hypothetical protein
MQQQVEAVLDTIWDAFCSLPIWADSLGEERVKNEFRPIVEKLVREAKPMSAAPDIGWFEGAEQEYEEACQEAKRRSWF